MTNCIFNRILLCFILYSFTDMEKTKHYEKWIIKMNSFYYLKKEFK